MTGSRVVVAMSGGVDSSVAALLLSRAGYEVIGVTMRLFDETPPGTGRGCCSSDDVSDARAVCRRLGVRHHFLNFEKAFRHHVMEPFVSEYARGRTPYPCAECNTWLKFNVLADRAALFDAAYIATGHYARVVRSDEGRRRLLRGLDRDKDQSYALYSLTQERMAHLLLPLGESKKDEARGLASEAGLPVADKPDSQDICFVPGGDYRAFVEPLLPRRIPGVMVDADGRVLAQHDGVHRFTIGQRRGLPLPGGTAEPLYVTRIDADTGTVSVGPAEQLASRMLRASAVNWVAGVQPGEPVRADVRIRYAAGRADATVTPVGDDALVEFDEPQRAATPGQAVVFYSGDEVLGGGTIEQTGIAAEIAPAASSGRRADESSA